MSRVLIIKLGYRQGLTSVVSRDVCLSSVLRATVLLNLFDGDEVTWLTSAAAVPLVAGARNIREVMVYDQAVSMDLSYETFDSVVNLEPGWEFCSLAQSVSARLRYGFTLDQSGHKVVPLAGAERAIGLELSATARRKETRPHQQILYEIMGREWQDESLCLGHQPGHGELIDVGFNQTIEQPYLTKAWPKASWLKLEEYLFHNYAVSWRDPEQSLTEKIAWVNSCRIIVTGDQLSMYLALALKKRVVGLFGPTPAARCHTYGRGINLTPSVKLNCIPCCELECKYGKPCTETIGPEQVAEAVDVLAHADVTEN